MNGSLIDNWSLELGKVSLFDAYNSEENMHNYFKYCSKKDMSSALYSLLSSIVLHDSIYFYRSLSTRFWDNDDWSSKQIREVVKPLNTSLDNYNLAIEYSSKVNLLGGNLNEPDIINKDALVYYFLANLSNNMYIPSPKRKDFLMNIHCLDNNILKSALLNKIEFESVEFLKSIYNEVGINMPKVTIPLIPNYLISKSNSAKDLIPNAVKLSKTKAIIYFKQWLSEFQKALDNHNMYEVKKSLLLVKEVEYMLEDELRYKEHLMQISLGLTPAVSFDIGIKNKLSKDRILITFMQDLYIERLKK